MSGFVSLLPNHSLRPIAKERWQAAASGLVGATGMQLWCKDWVGNGTRTDVSMEVEECLRQARQIVVCVVLGLSACIVLRHGLG